MITYKDRTWCETSIAKGCGNKDCFRNYTAEESLINNERVDLPLSIQPMKTKECGYEPV